MTVKHFTVDQRTVGPGQPAFLIAEIGNNHQGDPELAKRLVDLALEAGADAVKFQLRDMEAVYGKGFSDKHASADLGAQYTLDLLAKNQLTNDQLFAVMDYAEKRGILAFCTPWDEKSLEALERWGARLYKVASADLTNHALLRRIAETGKPMICSTGMATEEEITAAAILLSGLGAKFALLHCNSTYPAPFKDVNLRYMDRLHRFCPIVGYSGHERGFHVPIAAVARGATIVEKHFTIDRGLEGVDHKVSLLPDEFRRMVQQIREVEAALGEDSGTRRLSQGEMMNRENLAKSLVMKTALKKGERFTAAMVEAVSPGTGLPPYMLDRLVGQPAKRDLAAGDVLFRTDLPEASAVEPGTYRFSRPWGVPIRYHDAELFRSIAKPDFFEFHLSYGDMEVDPAKYLTGDYRNLDYTVHAPELFANDHLLDLVSRDPAYRAQSIENMRRTVAITNALKRFFPKTQRPFIVATLGGFTTDRPLSAAERKPLYAEMRETLLRVEDEGVEILPQSTAPFPWHMGGQQYQNLFLYPDETAEFCEKHRYRICLDVSHSYLACNHLRIDPKEYFEIVAPYTAHIHVGDSRGVDGEGMQIGDGEIDFRMLADVFRRRCPNAWFIPEIWQGHKNRGEGFWIALERLETMGGL
jgi:N-acetylneuraminate synthase